MLQNAYLLAKCGFDTAENEACKVCPLSACVETLTGVLFWCFDLLGNFRAACFPFETLSGSLLLLSVAILAQGVAAMSEAAAMG